MEPAKLSNRDVSRYSRQLLVSEFGVKGQQNLRDSSVLIVGAGGLGCPVATYLGGSGVGKIGIVDFDEVSRDNLHRQVAFSEESIGQPKADCLKSAILKLNSSIKVVSFRCALDKTNVLDIMKDFDCVADCTDNAATRYLLNDACVFLKKPLVSGSALRWEGQLTVYNYGETCPCYRCIFPVPPSASLVTNCNEGGVLGPAVGTIGTMQALEVIKVISKSGEPLTGRLYLFDGLTCRTRTIQLRKRNPDCDVCGENPKITELIDYEVFCGAGVNDKTPSLSLLSPCDRISPLLYSSLRLPSPPLLLDTRPSHEFQIANLPEAINIPLNQMKKMSAEELTSFIPLRDTKELFVVCHRGNDSQLAVRMLQEKLGDTVPSIRDIEGGYEAWAGTVDTDFPTY